MNIFTFKYKKPKELIIDFRINKDPLEQLTIKNEPVEIAGSTEKPVI